MANLWIIFITGITVGGLTCLAVQGGLLASVIASREDEIKGNERKHALYATAIFLVSKLIGYAILGFILGLFGEMINIGGTVQIYMQLFAGIYMILVAFNLLDIHPVFRYVVIQPPRFLSRIVRNKSKSKDIFAPAILGFLTIFIPCGTTIAVETLAISSANPIAGASIMLAFILGTTPLFLGIGVVTSFLGTALKNKFFKLAAVLIIYLGLSSIGGALTALGYFPVSITKKSNINTQTEVNQNPEIVITSTGYSPSRLTVRKGIPVSIKLISKDAYSCASAFRIPSLGINKNLGPNETQIITFTPQEEGEIPFSCSMGMYRGIIEVI